MEYITHHRYKKIAMSGRDMNIPVGFKFQTRAKGKIIATEDHKAICYTTSESAYKYFARNDDGRGLERGAITWAIAFGPRVDEETGARWSPKELECIYTKWEKFVRKDCPMLIFNYDFYNADMDELEEMAKDLNIKINEKE